MFDWLFSPDDPLTVRHFVWTATWEPWQQILMGLVCLAVLGLTWWNYRHMMPQTRRYGMLALRASALGLLIYVFYQPAFVEEKVQRSRRTVAVLVDDTQSLELPDVGGTRLNAVRGWLKEHAGLFEELSEDTDFVFYRFSDVVEEDGLDTLADNVTGQGQETHIVEAMATVVERLRTTRLGGFVIVSDGVDTGQLAYRLENATGLDADTQKFVKSLGVPIFGVHVSNPEGLRDVAVQNLRAGTFAFKLNTSSLDATVRITGYPDGTTVPVSLYEDGKLLSTSSVVVAPGQRDYDLSFDFVPRELGDRVYSVAATELPNELYSANNERWAIVRVIRDRIRVLQICGRTSWDERFLRNLLKRNPNVDLISFFILINTQSGFRLPSSETTLIPFPAHELFVEELGGFDLIVFQDFNYGPFQTRQYLPRIRDFIKGGGAFLMVGGARSFSEGGYHATEMTDILPMEIPPSFGGGESLDTEVFEPKLTSAGRSHPITQLSIDPAENDRLWKELPPLEGINKTKRMKPGGVTLLEHPKLRDDEGKPMPIVAAGEAGEGRVVTVMTDTTWEWSFLHSGDGGDSESYNTFYSNAIRWLIRDPELELVRIKVDEVQKALGTPTELEVSVFGVDYKPNPQHPLTVTVVRRGSVRQWGEAKMVHDSGKASTNADGQYLAQIEAKEPGVYEVEAKTRIGERQAKGRQVYVVEDRNPEFEAVVPPLDYLQLLAEASGGDTFHVSAEPEFRFPPPEVTQVVERNERALWSGIDILLLAALLLGSEWWLRRRYGYL